MDQVKKFTTNELIILGGCAAMIIGYFLKWFGVSYRGFSASVTGSEFFLQGTVPLLLSLVLGGVIIARGLGDVKLPDLPLPLAQIYVIAAAISAVLVILKLISGFHEADRKIGLFIATAGVVAQVVGAVLKMQAKEDDGATGGSTPPSPF